MLVAVIAKVFRQADTEETGTVDAGIVPDLSAKVIGAGIRESEMHLIRFKAESKAGEQRRKIGGRCRCTHTLYCTYCTSHIHDTTRTIHFSVVCTGLKCE